MERRYAPYSKWFGSAFKQLSCSAALLPSLEAVVRASDWRDRERHLSRAYEFVARMHNDLGITEPIEAKVTRFHNRPYLVLYGNRPEAIRNAIQDEEVLAMTPHIGSVDQFSDSTDILSYPKNRERLKALYGGEVVGPVH